MWRELRTRGLQTNATWIDEANIGESPDYQSLAVRCISEAANADGVILYLEQDDTLKGALLECGAALAKGRPVVQVGGSKPISRVFKSHPLWFSAVSIDEAIEVIRKIRAQPQTDLLTSPSGG